MKIIIVETVAFEPVDVQLRRPASTLLFQQDIRNEILRCSDGRERVPRTRVEPGDLLDAGPQTRSGKAKLPADSARPTFANLCQITVDHAPCVRIAPPVGLKLDEQALTKVGGKEAARLQMLKDAERSFDLMQRRPGIGGDLLERYAQQSII